MKLKRLLATAMAGLIAVGGAMSSYVASAEDTTYVRPLTGDEFIVAGTTIADSYIFEIDDYPCLRGNNDEIIRVTFTANYYKNGTSSITTIRISALDPTKDTTTAIGAQNVKVNDSEYGNLVSIEVPISKILDNAEAKGAVRDNIKKIGIMTTSTYALDNLIKVDIITPVESASVKSDDASLTIKDGSSATLSGNSITDSVANSVEAYDVDAIITPAEGATYKIYSDAACTLELSNMELSVGDNTVYIEVTAEDEATTEIYTLTVTRAEAPVDSSSTPDSSSTIDSSSEISSTPDSSSTIDLNSDISSINDSTSNVDSSSTANTSSDSKATSSSAAASSKGTSTASAKSSDSSPNTGAVAGGISVIAIVCLAGLTVIKKNK